MIDAGILLGLPRALAGQLIIQSAVGAAKMLAESDEHPVLLREAVTSPAGTTINAIRELEKHGVRAALLDAIEAAKDRSEARGKAHEGCRGRQSAAQASSRISVSNRDFPCSVS